MKTYDPSMTPDPDEWLSLDEDERIWLVTKHHRQTKVELPNEDLHAAFHVVVENQIALGDAEPTQATLERLMRDGLDRHEAIHAIAAVLVDFIHGVAADGTAPGGNERYYEELRKLNAGKIRKRQ